MKKSQREILDSSRQITRRGLMLAGIQVATVTTLALKMRSMQLDHAEEYRTLRTATRSRSGCCRRRAV